MAKTRLQRWIFASFGLAKVSIWMDKNRNLGNNAELVVQLQGVGNLDTELVNEENAVAQAIKLQKTAGATLPDAALLLPHRHIYQSFLWVLAAYELIRTVDGACLADSAIYGPDLSKEIKDYKHKIERLRIPLAKLEAAGRHKKTDFAMAYPVFINDREVAWLVNATTAISRRQLSDNLLTLAEKLRAST